MVETMMVLILEGIQKEIDALLLQMQSRSTLAVRLRQETRMAALLRLQERFSKALQLQEDQPRTPATRRQERPGAETHVTYH